MAEDEDRINNWRGRVDEDMRDMGERLSGVEAGVSSLGRSFDKFTHAFEASNDRQADLQKTRWPVVFGVLGIVTVVLGGFLSGYLRDLNRVERSVQLIQSKRISAQDPSQNLQIEELQRRLNLAEAAMMDHPHANDITTAENRIRIEDLMGELLDIRAEEHRDMKRDSAIVERVRAVERRVFHKPGIGIHGAETGHLHGSSD